MDNLTALRCKACKKKLMMISLESSTYIEIKCSRPQCGKINKIRLASQDREALARRVAPSHALDGSHERIG